MWPSTSPSTLGFSPPALTRIIVATSQTYTHKIFSISFRTSKPQPLPSRGDSRLAMSGTLPPGIYMIRHGGSNFATNPLSNGLSIKFLPSAEPLALATQLASLFSLSDPKIYITQLACNLYLAVAGLCPWHFNLHGHQDDFCVDHTEFRTRCTCHSQL